MQSLEVILQRGLRLGQLDREGFTDPGPQVAKDLDGEVLGAGHQRSGGGQRLQIVRGRRQLTIAALGVGSRAERGDEAAAELAPVGKDRRQNLTDLGGTELQQPVPAPAVERVTNPRRERRVEHRSVVLRYNQEVTMGRERRREAKLG